VASAINSEGHIVGIYRDTAGQMHGYLLSQGMFHSIDVPGAIFTVAIDINARGDIVGRYNTPTARAMAIF
jgi:hypothetical protein